MKLLHSRWCGISGWAMVCALLVGSLAWWLLPRYLAVHRWALPGTVIPQVLTAEGVLKGSSQHARHDSLSPHGFALDQFTFQLNIHDGSFLERKLPYVEFQRNPADELVGLKLRKQPHSSPGSVEMYQLTDMHDEVVEALQLVEKVIAVSDNNELVRAISSPLPQLPHALSTVGLIAMTPDQRWLILQYRRDHAWKPLHDKLLSLWPALASKLPSGSGYAILLYDRHTKEQYRINPGTTQQSPFAPGSVQPMLFLAASDNSGFIAASYPNLNGNPSIIPGTHSTISWYALPLRIEVWRWAVIFGLMLPPLVLSWLRRKRVKALFPGSEGVSVTNVGIPRPS